ncbi:MAG TPA: PRC-barrel domain-containing protein [Rubricoccaceae bacterium]|jgi:sporulation protein YlmC with PRC-barrel domain
MSHVPLSATSDWRLADDAQDIRGVDVVDATGARLGRIVELVVDTATETVSTVLLDDGTGIAVAELTVGDGLVTASPRATEAIAHKGLPAEQVGYSGRIVRHEDAR